MTSLERTFSLKVPSATENLALIREFVGNVGSQFAFESVRHLAHGSRHRAGGYSLDLA